MRFYFVGAALATTVLIVSAQDKSPSLPMPPPGLSELSQLKAENFKLKTQLTQCRVDLLDRESRLASSDLTGEQSRLEQQFRKELNCKSTDKFNWTSLKCEAPDVKKDDSPIK